MTARGVTFASSPAYGQTVALGPVQQDLLALLLELTAGDRRPELTLGELASRLGRAVSSVHEAIGRLRALGLIGFAARMGRRGGHRIWRVRSAAPRQLDRQGHRRAVARLIARFGRTIEGRSFLDSGREIGGGGRVTLPIRTLDSEANDPTDRRPTPPPAGDPSSQTTLSDHLDRLHDNPDPFSVGRPDAGSVHGGPDPASRAREPFGDKLRRYGLGPWIDERDHGRLPRTGESVDR